jgi:hypothetical protein
MHLHGVSLSLFKVLHLGQLLLTDIAVTTMRVGLLGMRSPVFGFKWEVEEALVLFTSQTMLILKKSFFNSPMRILDRFAPL